MAENPVVDKLSWADARSMTPMQRAFHYSVLDGDCIVFMGAATKGYGIFQADGRTHRIHEWAYEQHTGEPTPPGIDLHHLCGTKRCWKIEHLQPLPAGEHNLLHGTRGQAALNAEKTHCKNDHPLEGDNLWVEKNGSRHCRACRAEAARRFRARKKEAV